MIGEADASAVARIFGLGDGAALTGTIARGEQGLVAQLAGKPVPTVVVGQIHATARDRLHSASLPVE